MADAGILEVVKPEEDVSLEVFDSVAERAAEELGYKLLKEKRDKLEARNRLVQALAKLGIPVYDPDSVDRYKAATLKEARSQMWRREWRTGRWFAVTSAVLIGAAPLFVTSNRSIFVTLFGGGLVAAAITLIGLHLAKEQAQKIGWRKQFVSQHNASEIPTFVLTRALALRTECPDVNFEIESVMAEKIDPFLVAEAGGEHFYIAYWNEPGFRAVEQVVNS